MDRRNHRNTPRPAKKRKPVITFREENGERDQAWTDIVKKLKEWAKAHKATPTRPGKTVNPTDEQPRSAVQPKHIPDTARNPAPPKPVTFANPFDPWTPATPPRFVGRAHELQRLEAALQESRSVSLVGDWRIGKSSLLLAWRHQAQSKGRVVSWVSGEGPEAKSQGVFVQAITSAPPPRRCRQRRG